MRAVVLRSHGGPEVLRLEEVSDPRPEPREVVVRLRAAALNHRDVWIRIGRYAGIKMPLILGSDGAGEVVETGTDVDRAWLGREVVIDPAFDWGADERAQGSGFNILGLPRDGTYAELVKVPADHLHDKPHHLSWEEAAAVPLASVTAYRALVTRARVQSGETVVVTGIGGGVATCTLLIGVRLGGTVFVTSGSDAKIDAARSHGAAGGVNHTDPEWPKALVALIRTRPDVVIEGLAARRSTRRSIWSGRVVASSPTVRPSVLQRTSKSGVFSGSSSTCWGARWERRTIFATCCSSMRMGCVLWSTACCRSTMPWTRISGWKRDGSSGRSC